MHRQESTIVEVADAQRRNNRRMHETEFIMHNFQKAVAAVDTFENKVVELEKGLRGTEEAHLLKFKEINK